MKELDSNVKEGYVRLFGNIEDVIAEEQAKLGYNKEVIRLYYPLSSLNHFFKTEVSAPEMLEILKGFSEYSGKKAAGIEVSAKGERFCFVMPEEITEYVHNNIGRNEFIFELVNTINNHGATMQDVIDLFKRQPYHSDVREDQSDEFDIMIRFTDSDDKYYYCFKDEGCHIIYHRFLPEDYKDVL